MGKKKILSILLATTLALGTVAFSGCRDNEKDAAQVSTESVQNANDNMTMTAQGGCGIQMMSVLIPSNEYANYGVSANAESARLVTGWYDDEYVSNPAVYWSIEFVNASSEWATGKRATDYVTVTVLEAPAENKFQAVFECKSAFGEQILAVCKSRQSPDIFKSFIIDYSTKITKMDVDFIGVNDSWKFADVGFDMLYTDCASDITGETCNNVVNLNANEIVGIYSLDMSVHTTTTGTLLEWQESAPWDNCWVEISDASNFIARVDASTILSKKTNLETDSNGRVRSCGVLGLPYAEYLSESSLYKILYHWTKRNGGDVSDSRLSAYNDGGAAYNEYCRIMNKMTQTAGVLSNRLSYTYSIDIGHVYKGKAVEIDINFTISDASEYFIVEPTGITLDTDHIIFEP